MELQRCHWIRFRNNVMNLPKRKHIRLKGYDYSQNGLYFITICVKDKHEILWEHNPVGTTSGRPNGCGHSNPD